MALSNNPNQHTGKVKKDITKYLNTAKSAIAAEDYTAARKAIRKLERYSKAAALEQAIVLEITRENFAAAEKEFRKFRSLSKNNRVYQNYLESRILIAQRRYSEALKVLERTDISGIEIDSGILLNIRINLAKCYNILGNCKKFSETCAEIYKHSPSAMTATANYKNYLFSLHFLPLSIEEQRKAAEKFQTFFEETKQYTHPKPAKKKEKLRIGYISADFRYHVVLRFSYVLFLKYDHERFEVYLYANNKEDFYSKHLSSITDKWTNILGRSSEEIADIIHNDQIDILVDLSGHTDGNCLPALAYKPAPIQISGIGYWASTGLKAIDYFLGDRYLDTEEAKQGFTEEIIELPNSHFCCSELPDMPSVGELPYRRNGYITFGCFNKFTKINDEVLKTWAKIMQKVSDSRLLLKGKIFNREDDAEFAIRRIAGAGIPLERVETRGFAGNYIGEYNDMDIALDTFPYPGGGTTCDALLMSVPVITIKGKSHGERFGVSILENAGLGELCADSVDEYIEKSVKIAQDPEYLDKLHRTVRDMMMGSPVMDSELYMKNIQNAYETVWKRYVEQRWQED